METNKEIITHEIIFDKLEFIEDAKAKLREKIKATGKSYLTIKESHDIGRKLGH